ncbi:MAG: ribonuclease Z [Candidatus Thorarchaeota archaeon]
MMIEVVILGSGGSIPTKNRNHPSILIRYDGWNLLFDCGEDTQRQFEYANAGLNKRAAWFITHMHGDHVLGISGLLLRMSLLGRIRPLKIFGPEALIDFVKLSQSTINLGTTFHTTVYSIEEGVVFQEGNSQVRAFEVDHRGFALGYEFVYQKPTGPFLIEKAAELRIPKGPLWKKLSSGEKITLDDGREISPEDVTGDKPRGLKIVYSGDTRPCQAVRESADGANILIHEAMYTIEHSDLAKERGHTTAAEAAKLAKEAGVELLVLTHYSPRYDDGSAILSEAKEIFQNTILARDLMKITLNSDGTCIIKDEE